MQREANRNKIIVGREGNLIIEEEILEGKALQAQAI